MLSKNKHKCLHCIPDITKDLKIEYYCNKKSINGFMDFKINKSDCDTCEFYESRNIEYPIEVMKITNAPINKNQSIPIGTTCLIKKDFDSDETEDGVYIGEFPIMIVSSYDKNTKEITNIPAMNPAFYIEATKQVIYGCECWWTIKKENLKK